MMNPEQKRQYAIQAFSDFLNTPLDTQLQRHCDIEATSTALKLFYNVAATVPGYKSFLKQNDIDPSSIKTYTDFQALPPLTKQNYLQKHSLADLCRYGQIESSDMIAASSGSTGKPTYWCRFFADELEITTRFEQIFHDSFFADTRPTLAVICFTLGTWVGGMFTTNCCRYLAMKGYPITVITPGNNKEEILRVVSELGANFEQVVLLGYPPFLKDVIDTGIARGVDWRQYNIKLVTAGEVFSEEWRSLVAERIGSQNPCYDFASLYGTADAGVLGNETPLSICIRRFLAETPEAARALFGESRLPTLVQYDPMSRFFEVEDGALLFSGDNGIPLIRYNILDNGGVITYDAMIEFLAGWGFDPVNVLHAHPHDAHDAHDPHDPHPRRVGLYEQSPPTLRDILRITRAKIRGVRNLPFVYVFGRSNFTVSYFGANIYPENVTVGLEVPGIREWVTGKFVLQVIEDSDKNRFLTITVELAPGVDGSEEKKQAITTSILTQLRRLNSEFANYVPAEYQAPQITLKLHGDAEYFPIGVKHRYTRA